jgi:hypothetical protein
MPTVTEPVRDIRTGEVTGTVTVTVETPAETAARVAAENAAVTNEDAIRQQSAAALSANVADIAAGESWLANNTGSTLSSAVLTTAVKFLVRCMIASLRQRNGLIRLLLRRLDGVD